MPERNPLVFGEEIRLKCLLLPKVFTVYFQIQIKNLIFFRLPVRVLFIAAQPHMLSGYRVFFPIHLDSASSSTASKGRTSRPLCLNFVSPMQTDAKLGENWHRAG